jgi:hypothetical protein
MLKTTGNSALTFKFGHRLFICLRSRHLDAALRERINPFVLGGLACWCDKLSPAEVSTVSPANNA